MPLKIKRADEGLDVGALVTVIYGPPGIGKTTLGYMCRKPLMLDFERGARRAALRGDLVEVGSWEDVSELSASDFVDASGEQYRTIIVDTVGRALDHLSAVITRDQRNRKASGGLSQSGYGALGTDFANWLRKLTLLGIDVVLIAHGEETVRDETTVERIDVPGGMSRKEIHKTADIMGKMHMVEGKRTLTFTTSEASYGKDPGMLNSVEVPLPTENTMFLSDLIDRTRMVMEERVGSTGISGAPMLSDLQEAVASQPGSSFTDYFDKPAIAASLTREARIMIQRKASVDEVQNLGGIAKEYGLVWDKEEKQYIEDTSAVAVDEAEQSEEEVEAELPVMEEAPA